MAGHEGMPYGGPYGFSDVEVAATKSDQLSAPKYLNFRKVTIYGGTNEIQKNIIAKAVLEYKKGSMNLSFTDEQNPFKG